jgi:hypothetical protein
MISGSLVKKSFYDPFPFIDLDIRLTANVLELPGFPVINTGILFKIHVIITNTFSLSGVFLPILGGNSITSRYPDYSFDKQFIKKSFFNYL